MLLEPVDAANHGRFAGPRRPADHDPLAPLHLEVDVLQDVEFTIPLVHAVEPDGGIGGSVRGGRRNGRHGQSPVNACDRR